MMSKKSTDLTIEKVSDVNDYFCDNYDYLKKLSLSGLNNGIHCFEAIMFDGSRHFVKKCSKSYVRRSNIDNPWNEINALQIISLIKSKYFPAFINAIEDDQYICLISEYIEGIDLFNKIQKSQNGLSPYKAQRYLIQISQALRQLHCNNLCHLDISSENIIIDKNDNIKVIDFGVCSKIIDNQTNKNEEKHNYDQHNESDNDIEEEKKDINLTYNKHIRSRLLPGKCGYRAPEIETRQECDPKLVDAFSFGYMAWTMLCGNMPFQSAHPNDETYRKYMQYGAEKWIKMISYTMDDIKKVDIPPNAIKMLSDLLECNTYKRKSIEDLLNDNTSFLHHEYDEKKSEEKKIDIGKVEIRSSLEINSKIIGLNVQFSH